MTTLERIDPDSPLAALPVFARARAETGGAATMFRSVGGGFGSLLGVWSAIAVWLSLHAATAVVLVAR